MQAEDQIRLAADSIQQESMYSDMQTCAFMMYKKKQLCVA